MVQIPLNIATTGINFSGHFCPIWHHPYLYFFSKIGTLRRYSSITYVHFWKILGGLRKSNFVIPLWQNFCINTVCKSEWDIFHQPLRRFRFHEILVINFLFPTHGQLSYLTETFRRSQYYGLQDHSHSAVRMKEIENISHLLRTNHSFNSDFLESNSVLSLVKV